MGIGNFGVPDDVTVEVWTDFTGGYNENEIDPDLVDDGLLKIIKHTFPVNPIYFSYPPTTCVWDGVSKCDNPGNWYCGCSGCTPFSCSCGTYGTFPLQNIPGSWNYGRSYGNCCMVSYNQNDVNDRSTRECLADLPEHVYLVCGGSYCNYASAQSPRCFYKDCLMSISIDGNSPSQVQFISTQATTLEFGSPEWKVPKIHGGYCKWAIVDDDSKICGTCQHPYIRCTRPDNPAFHDYSFQPRLCGQGKCRFFEGK